MTEEAIERVAMEDLLYLSEEPQRDREPLKWYQSP
jgi:hypothetical protein